MHSPRSVCCLDWPHFYLRPACSPVPVHQWWPGGHPTLGLPLEMQAAPRPTLSVAPLHARAVGADCLMVVFAEMPPAMMTLIIAAVVVLIIVAAVGFVYTKGGQGQGARRNTEHTSPSQR